MRPERQSYLSDDQFFQLVRIVSDNGLSGQLRTSLVSSLNSKFYKIARAYVNTPVDNNPIYEYTLLLDMVMKAKQKKNIQSNRIEPFLYLYLRDYCSQNPPQTIGVIHTMVKYIWTYGYQDKAILQYMGQVLIDNLGEELTREELPTLVRIYGMMVEMHTSLPEVV